MRRGPLDLFKNESEILTIGQLELAQQRLRHRDLLRHRYLGANRRAYSRYDLPADCFVT